MLELTVRHPDPKAHHKAILWQHGPLTGCSPQQRPGRGEGPIQFRINRSI